MVNIQITPDDRFELALRASNEGIWQWNVETGDVSYSERVLLFLGTPLGDAPNIFVDAELYLHEEDLPKFKLGLGAMLKLQGEDVFAVDCRYRRPDGIYAWLRIRGACVRNDTGSVVRIAGSIIDVSKRKSAELALEEERHLLRQLIENIPNNIYFKDVGSRFVMANDATAKKMGFESSKDILGKNDFDFFDKSHAAKSR